MASQGCDAYMDVPKEELARRAAQSAKDKAQAQRKSKGRKLAGTTSRKKAAREFKAKLPAMSRYDALVSAQARATLKAPRVRAHDAVDLLAAMLDPDHNIPFRLPGGAPTFVNKLRRKLMIQQPPAGAAMQVNAGFAIVRRDPRLASIHYEYKGTGQSSVYQLRSQVQGNYDKVTFTAANTYLDFALSLYVSGWERHDDFLVPVVYKDGIKRFWAQNEAAAVSNITMAGLAASTSYTLTLNWLCNGQIIKDSITSTSDASGNITFLFPASERLGYLGLAFSGSANNVQVVFADNSKNAYCHLALPELRNSGIDIENLRINSASVMLSDRSSEYVSQGSACSVQIGGGEDWTSILNLQPQGNASVDPYQITSKSQKPFTAPYKEGRYLPLKPIDDPRENQMVEMFDEGVLESVAPIKSEDMLDFVYIGYNIGTAVSGAAPAGEYTFCWGVEGISESQWRDNETPRTHPDAYKEAKYAYSQVKVDLGNPNHLKKIWEAIKTIAPKLFGAVEMAAPLLPPQYAAPVMAASGIGRYLLSP